MESKAYKADLIFAVEWMSYRLDQCHQRITRPFPHFEPVILADYRIDSLRKIAKLIQNRFPSSEENLCDWLDFFIEATGQYSSEVNQWIEVIQEFESIYANELKEQQEIDVEQVSKGKKILIPNNCIYFHENEAELLANWTRQNLGQGIQDAGVRHKLLKNKAFKTASPKQYHNVYHHTYRVQAGGLWRNQQLVDNYFRQQSAPIPWIFNIFPMQWHDRRCGSIFQNSQWGSWDDVGKEIGTEFTFLGIRHKWVDHDQYAQLTGLPYRLPDIPVGRIYLPEMQRAIEKIKLERKIAPSPFTEVLNIIKSVTSDSVTAHGYTVDTAAHDVIEELTMGIRPQFLSRLEKAVSIVIPNSKHFLLKTPELEHPEDKPKQNIFSVQEQLFTEIFNILGRTKIRSLKSDDSAKSDEIDFARKFYAWVADLHVNDKAAAIYGLIALKCESKDSSIIYYEIQDQLQKHWGLGDKLEKKICSRARRILLNLGATFEPPIPGMRGDWSNNCSCMNPLLESILKKIVEQNYSRKQFGL